MSLLRACDACKLRKVKCDMSDPCANCRMSQFCCAYNFQPRKRGRKATGNPRKMAPKEQQRRESATSERSLSTASSSAPQSLVSFANGLSVGEESTSKLCATASQIHEKLLTAIVHALPLDTVEGVIHRCLDLFAQYLFPILPIVHEPTLRESVSLFGCNRDAHFWLSTHSSILFTEGLLPLGQFRTFTLVTALCASISSALPESFPAQRRPVASAFLAASREMLQLYKDHDIEHPDSSSLSIRMWQARALQSITGSDCAFSHCIMEAAVIAQRLRLYEEDTLRQEAAVEAQLLRACFWGLYSADKAAFIFGDRPYILDEMLFAGDLTLHERGENIEPLLDTSNSFNQGSLEDRLSHGFWLQHRLWAFAGNFIRDIRLHLRSKEKFPPSSETGVPEFAHFTRLYLAFIGLVDEFPPWLHLLDMEDGSLDASVRSYHRTCFLVQRGNFMSVYHCLGLIILQICIDHNILPIIGLDNQGLSLEIKKAEICRDFLQELQMMPFICFKVLGEAMVSRVRRVGAILLELVQKVENDMMKARASAMFTRLLDFLARLDSKASDKLIGTRGLVSQVSS